jgi:hypothetical protein
VPLTDPISWSAFSRGLFGKAIAYGLPFGGRFFPVVSSSQSRNGLMMRPSPFMSWRPHWVLATWIWFDQSVKIIWPCAPGAPAPHSVVVNLEAGGRSRPFAMVSL